jgi:hypothetical protein
MWKIIAVILWAWIPLCGQPLRGDAPGVWMQAAHDQKKKANPVTGDSTTDQRGTQVLPFVVDTEGHKKTDAEKAEAKRKDDDNDRTNRWTLDATIGSAFFAGLAALFTGMLVCIGWRGVEAAKETLLDIKRQADLMEVAYQQWIDVSNWQCAARFATAAAPTPAQQFGFENQSVTVEAVTVVFEVQNPTDYPLIIPSGQINLTLQNEVGTTHCFTGDGARLNPKQVQVKDVPFRLTENQSAQYVGGELLISVEGQLDFIDVLGRKQPHPIHGMLRCSTRGARFQSDVMWEHRADDKGRAPSDQGEQKAN